MLASAINPAEIALIAIAFYAVLGCIFALAFVTRGARALDPAISESPRHVRLLFIPGAIALWPLIVVKWFAARNTHQ